MATSALSLRDIDAYYGDSHVLQKVSFALGEGRLLGLLGRNGAGKSTCMNVTVGLLPPRARRRSRCSARRSRGLPPEQIAARGVALVPQGRRIFKSLTVRENLIVAARKPEAGSQHAPWTVDTVFAHVPAARRAPQPDRRASVRRRAADAGDRPRADGQSARAADGRAVRRPGAADRRRGDGAPSASSRRAGCRSCWSSRTPSSSSTSPTTSSSSTAAASAVVSTPTAAASTDARRPAPASRVYF